MLSFQTLDVFTEVLYTGNPLAVVLGADDLTTAQMQTIAREFNLSETIFVMAPRDPAHTARVRIFFPTAEIPFAGHPTLGCAVLLAGMAQGEGDWDATVVLEEEAGLVPVALARRGGVTRGRFAAPVLPVQVGEADAALVAEALGLTPAQVGRGPHRAGVWQGGPSFLIVPVADAAALAQAAPREPAWSALMAAAGVDSAFLHAPGTVTDLETRMFSPTAGIPEDPATGSATALLSGALHAAGVLAEGETRLTLRQGAQMGRPSRPDLTVTVTGGRIAAVHVGGAAVPLSEGRLRPPS